MTRIVSSKAGRSTRLRNEIEIGRSLWLLGGTSRKFCYFDKIFNAGFPGFRRSRIEGLAGDKVCTGIRNEPSLLGDVGRDA